MTRRITDWPSDLVQLVDALALESVAVLSLHEGVAYALAAAAVVPERIDRAAVLAARSPSWMQVPILQPARLAYQTRRFHRNPPVATDRSVRRLPAPDRSYLSAPAARAAVESSIAGTLRHPHGVFDDLRLVSAHWGFDPALISVDTGIWHGGRDGRRASRMARDLHHRIEASVLRVEPSLGSYSLLDDPRALVEYLVGGRG